MIVRKKILTALGAMAVVAALAPRRVALADEFGECNGKKFWCAGIDECAGWDSAGKCTQWNNVATRYTDTTEREM